MFKINKKGFFTIAIGLGMVITMAVVVVIAIVYTGVLIAHLARNALTWTGALLIVGTLIIMRKIVYSMIILGIALIITNIILSANNILLIGGG